MAADDHELDPRLRQAVATLREPAAPAPGFDARLMAMLRAEPVRRGALAWLLDPWTVRLSPVGVVAGLVLVFGAGVTVALAPWRTAAPAEQRVESVAGPVPVVRFVIAAPAAGRVNLVGSFNDWDPEATPLRAAAGGGVWTVEVPLPPGRYEYAFVVDGREWLPDPDGPLSPVDEYGVPNSVLTVSGSS